MREACFGIDVDVVLTRDEIGHGKTGPFLLQ